jgi:hypothetical protein
MSHSDWEPFLIMSEHKSYSHDAVMSMLTNIAVFHPDDLSERRFTEQSYYALRYMNQFLVASKTVGDARSLAILLCTLDVSSCQKDLHLISDTRIPCIAFNQHPLSRVTRRYDHFWYLL